jgi:hypothetical protein
VEEWYGKADALARQRGDRDIETPRGDLRGNGRKIEGRGVGAVEFHRYCETDGSFELALAKRRWLHAYAFVTDQDRAIWELHCDGASGHEIARRLRLDANIPKRAMRRLLAAFEKRDERKRGRPANPDSLRAQGVALHVRLHRGATLAMDHIRVALSVSNQEAIRLALVYFARKNG